MKLSELKENQNAVVAKLDGDNRFISRITSIGLTPGCRLQVVLFSANDKKGYAPFYNALERAVAEKKTLDTSSLEALYEKIAEYSEVKKLMPEDLIPGYSPMWLAAKTLENDPVVLAKLKNTLDTETVSNIDGYRKGAQGAVETGGAKFSWIDGILAGAVTEKTESLTLGRLDRIYTHKTWGKPAVVLTIALAWAVPCGAELMNMGEMWEVVR